MNPWWKQVPRRTAIAMVRGQLPLAASPGPPGPPGPQGLDGAPGATGPAGNIADGSKGDIVVSDNGETMQFDESVVTDFARTLLAAETAADARQVLGVAPTMIVHLWGTSTGTWTNMAAAESLSFANVQTVRKVDLTHYTHVRLHALSQSAYTGSAAHLRYALTWPGTTVGNYLVMGDGATEVACPLKVGTPYTLTNSGWFALRSEARTDVFVGVTGSGGDGTFDPAILSFYAEFATQAP